MHVSIDGFVAGPKGEMNWIIVDDELFGFANVLIDQADTALYGRNTYDMMQAYWPTAGDQPNATKHDIDHSRWYNSVPKVVLSRAIKDDVSENRTVISDYLSESVNELKSKEGKNILMFGSPLAFHSLLLEGLVDEFWLFQNPVILGTEIPFFKDVHSTIKLTLKESKQYSSGVVGLHYSKGNS